MAFPTIADADTTSGTQTSNASTWTITYAGSIAAGDLLLLFMAQDGPNGISAAGWHRKIDLGSGANALAMLIRIAAGGESGTFSVSMGASEQGAWRMFRIPAASWFGGSLGTAGVNDADGLRFEATITGSPSANPDPPLNNPANWDVEDTLWIAACSADTSRTISVYPLAGRNTAGVSGGSGGATLGLCTTESAVASLDPGTFTISSSDDWAAATVAIRPAAADVYVPRHPAINHQNPALV